MELYFHEDNIQYKNARPRGKKLEIERIITIPTKNNYTEENMALACYICNNAKSDFISAKNFKVIAKGINGFWKQVLQKEVLFDDNAKIWNKE